MNLLIKVLWIIVLFASGVITVWSLFKATKEHGKGETLKAIYYMLFSILFFLMNKLA